MYVDSSGTDDHLMGYHVRKAYSPWQFVRYFRFLVKFKTKENASFYRMKRARKSLVVRKRAKKLSAAGLFIIS
jgi:hypothetical protein